MSDFQPLVESNRRLTEAVENKVGEIDQRVEQAEQEFEQFQSSADDRYMTRKFTSFSVGGDVDKFYPVFIPASHSGIATITIGRYVHQNQEWRGAMSLRFLAQSYGWGGYPAVNIIDVLKQQFHTTATPIDIRTDGFLAKYSNPVTVNGIVFWLRGDCSYVVSSSLLNIGGEITNTGKVTDRATALRPQQENKVGIFLSGVEYVESGVTEKWDIENARDTVQIPNIQIIRGV
ncbi:hypothetical protein [Vibrio vulnificus]|uniref:hypothetical protein n=1 Tax=Vibrio vulnificus TaxID=672 RepID=UPI000D738992|nr:hypothetical protein [Vibrio vulnificus]PWY32260.1 hypothetical protein VV86_17335 [Vibrio vulnificus]